VSDKFVNVLKKHIFLLLGNRLNDKFAVVRVEEETSARSCTLASVLGLSLVESEVKGHHDVFRFHFIHTHDESKLLHLETRQFLLNLELLKVLINLDLNLEEGTVLDINFGFTLRSRIVDVIFYYLCLFYYF